MSMSIPNLAIVDGNSMRRVQVVRQMHGYGWHVEPFEDLAEFARLDHQRRLVLVYDGNNLVADVINHCRSNDQVASIVAYSEKPEADAVVAAIRLGAMSYFDWSLGAVGVLSRIADWLEAAAHEWPRQERNFQSARLVQRLTRREREVLTYITMGHSTRSISQELLISYRTVELHRAHVLEKLVASNASDAVRIAMEAGIAS